jgi:nicotinate-nucleotide--dimethylbenzimidazole phosphoribosyltransferase
MVLNFLAGGAGVNVLARQAGAEVWVADAGVKGGAAFPDHPQLLKRSLGPGTADFTQGSAMTRSQAEQAVHGGREAAAALHARGVQMLATGDMGIGNTTSSAAVVSAVLGLDPGLVTGRGTGVGPEAWERKKEVVREGIQRNHPDGKDGMDVLAKVGGFEIGFLAGAILGAAERRVPVVADGFISGAAALLAWRLDPTCRDYLVAGHQSVEIGHRHVLEALGLRPYLNLDLRLGEGTGAVLCFHLVDAACRVVREMATFQSAGVSDKEGKGKG